MSDRDERLLSGHTGRMFLVLTAAIATVKLGRRALPPLLPSIAGDLALTAFETGLVLTTVAAALAIMQYPGGRIADGLSRKTAIAGGFAVGLVGALLLAGAPAFAALAAGAALVGAGEGLYGPADRALLSDLFRDRRGRAFGVHTVFSDVSGVAGAGLAVAALAAATWRAAFLVPAFVLAVLVVAVHRLSREAVVVAPVSLEARGTVARLAHSPRALQMALVYSLYSFTVEGVIGFLPTVLQVERGASPGLAGGIFALLFAVGFVSRPVAGLLSDRIPRPYVAGTSLLLAGAGVVAIAAAPSLPLAVAGVVLFGFGDRSFAPAAQAYLMDVLPDDTRGGDFGAVRTVYKLVGGLGPAYVGAVAGTAGYTAAFAGFVVPLLAGGAVLFGAVARG